MTNCLSAAALQNLLFKRPNWRCGEPPRCLTPARGCHRTKPSARFVLRRKKKSSAPETITAWFRLQTAVIPNIRLGNVCMEKLQVLGRDDADFALSYENGRFFPAEMLLDGTVISRYRWSYSQKINPYRSAWKRRLNI